MATVMSTRARAASLCAFLLLACDTTTAGPGAGADSGAVVSSDAAVPPDAGHEANTDAEPPASPFQADPPSATMFGQVPVVLTGDFSALGEIRAVTFNDIRAVEVVAAPTQITVRIQGAPTPGPATVVVTGANGEVSSATAFVYEPPVGGAPLTWAAFGASFTQGAQSGGITPHGQRMSWASQVARAAGVFLGPPLFVEGFAPTLLPADFVGACDTQVDPGALAGQVVRSLTDPETGRADLRRGRQDPTLPTRNFAVGGARVAQVVAPAAGILGLIERITELPDGTSTELGGPPLERSQLDRLVALDPDIAVSADLLGNDAQTGLLDTGAIDLERMTPVAELQQQLDELAERLGALHGQFFIANFPPIEVLPRVGDLRAKAIGAGLETEASYPQKLAEMNQRLAAYNDALGAALAPYPNLHVVDVSGEIQRLVRDGLVLDGQRLGPEKFGGIFSLDFGHLTDTGYALMANWFIEAINTTLDLDVPPVDLSVVLAGDARSPASLTAAGVDCRVE